MTRTDHYYLDIAHDLPGYNWEVLPDGLIEIGYTDPGTDKQVWIAGAFVTFRDAMIALGRYLAAPTANHRNL